MTRFTILGRSCALALLTAGAAWAQAADVLPAKRRSVSVEQARELLQVPELPPLPENAKNPFVAEQPAAAPARAGVPAAVPGVRERLQAMAPLINPSGTMNLGGQPILLFGQKKIKVGDSLPITFDGQPYVLVISDIQSTSFTLRLDGEEITRPINPANRP